MSRVDFNKTYNVIYINWGFNYLNDPEVYTLLERAKHSLTTWNKRPGIIITKETIAEEK
jgi:hypothetical protein